MALSTTLAPAVTLAGMEESVLAALQAIDEAVEATQREETFPIPRSTKPTSPR
jgi:hypothetical protein